MVKSEYDSRKEEVKQHITELWRKLIEGLAKCAREKNPLNEDRIKETLSRRCINNLIDQKLFLKSQGLNIGYSSHGLDFKQKGNSRIYLELEGKMVKHISGTGIFNALPHLLTFGPIGAWISYLEKSQKKQIIFSGITSGKGRTRKLFYLVVLEKINQFWYLEQNTDYHYSWSNNAAIFNGTVSSEGTAAIKDNFATGFLSGAEAKSLRRSSKWLKEKETLISNIIKQTIEHNCKQSYKDEANKEPINIFILPIPNLGHQFMNVYGGALIACSKLGVQGKDFQLYYDAETNYFPTESIGEYFGCKTTPYGKGLLLFRGAGICLDCRGSHYCLANSILKDFCTRHRSDVVKRKGKINNNANIVIFSLKCGNAKFSNIQFSIEDAFKITSETIKQLNQELPNDYQFIIDGMTSPHIPKEQQEPAEEPEQRKYFKESEEHWFGKLREQLPGIELTFINGMNLIEKYPYYQAASKFIRFGDGSYHMAWQALKESKPSNQLALLINDSEANKERLISKTSSSATFSEHINHELSTSNVVNFVKTGLARFSLPMKNKKNK